MTRAWVSLTVLLATAGLLCWAAERGTREQDAAAVAGLMIGEPLRAGNLTIFPVVSKTPKLDDRFITLDEGLRSGKIEILEVGAVTGGGQPSRINAPPQPNVNPFGDAPNLANAPAADQQQEGDGAQTDAIEENSQDNRPQQIEQLAIQYGGNDVHRLMVVNRSEKPLYLMPGEVIVGGDQDRTIGRELVIAPTGKPTPISVFCVEHGRWGNRDTQQYAGYLSTDLALTVANAAPARNTDVDAASQSVDLEAIAQQANAGKFIGSIGSLNKEARLAVQKGEGQSEVWNQVSQQNAASRVKPESGAFAANYASKDVVEQLDRYQTALEKKIAATPNVVGVIVAVNGKVESMDVFESTPLFTKLWPKLLKSYALDALSAEGGNEDGEKRLRVADAKRFMNEVAAASTKDVDRGEGGLATVQAESDRVLLFSARQQGGAGAMSSVAESSIPLSEDLPMLYPSADAAPAAYGGSFGGGVHTSAFSK